MHYEQCDWFAAKISRFPPNRAPRSSPLLVSISCNNKWFPIKGYLTSTTIDPTELVGHTKVASLPCLDQCTSRWCSMIGTEVRAG